MQVQRQGFLAFAAANLLIYFIKKLIYFERPHVLTKEISNAIGTQ